MIAGKYPDVKISKEKTVRQFMIENEDLDWRVVDTRPSIDRYSVFVFSKFTAYQESELKCQKAKC